MNYKEAYEKWLSSKWLSDAEISELSSLSETEKEERFYSDLAFGTAGLRGILGLGTFRMNVYTVRHATQALADIISAQGKEAKERGVVIAHDCRIMSEEFTFEAASVLVANGISVYVFDELRPTPELSFAVRDLSCIAGINITASHNPKEYNGYKVYWEDGAQIDKTLADAILSRRNELDIFDGVKVASKEETDEKVKILDKSYDEKYMSKVLSQIIDKDVISDCKDMKIVYTPFHGTGYRLVPEVLKRAGFENVLFVEEQMKTDGAFPTVKSPNPEETKSFKMAIDLAEKTGSDLVIGTDPDADRVGVCVKNEEGKFVALTGNQTGALILEYLISAKKKKGILPENPAVVKTIVTSELGTRICEKNGVYITNVLTGFKFIGEKMEEFEKSGKYTYLFGYEESYGSLVGDYARDKDAVVASLILSEIAAFYHKQKKTLYDALTEIFEKYGYHSESVFNIYMDGASAFEKMAEFMSGLRKNPPEKIGGINVAKALDFSEGLWNLPKSNVLYYKLEENSVVVVRPSGTEPKIKVYFMTHGKDRTEAETKLETLKTDFCNRIER